MLFDYMIPVLIAKRDKSKNSDYGSLFHAATLYKSQLEARYLRYEQRLIRRRLWPLIRKIEPLNIDHQNFLREREERIQEILCKDGISEADRQKLINKTENQTVFAYTEKIGTTEKSVILDIVEIKKLKSQLCSQANEVIAKQNSIFKKHWSKYNYRFANYLKEVNQNKFDKEIRLELTIKPKIIPFWDYNEPVLSGKEY